MSDSQTAAHDQHNTNFLAGVWLIGCIMMTTGSLLLQRVDLGPGLLVGMGACLVGVSSSFWRCVWEAVTDGK